MSIMLFTHLVAVRAAYKAVTCPDCPFFDPDGVCLAEGENRIMETTDEKPAWCPIVHAIGAVVI